MYLVVAHQRAIRAQTIAEALHDGTVGARFLGATALQVFNPDDAGFKFLSADIAVFSSIPTCREANAYHASHDTESIMRFVIVILLIENEHFQ